MTSLINRYIRVSSVLNRDNNNYGKQHLIDGSDETCWNSEQGLPQHILLDFAQEVEVSKISLTFQGGFVGKKCVVLGSVKESANDYNIQLGTFYPDDVNSTQVFPVPSTQPLKRMKIIFEESTDFYGRITIYKLDVQ